MNLVEATITAGSPERGAAPYARRLFALKGLLRTIIFVILASLLASLSFSGAHASSLRIRGELIESARERP